MTEPATSGPDLSATNIGPPSAPDGAPPPTPPEVHPPGSAGGRFRTAMTPLLKMIRRTPRTDA